MKIYSVYMVICTDGALYIGVTDDVTRRLMEHNQGIDRNAFTFKRRPVHLLYQEQFTWVYAAIEREKQLKKWTRAKKLALANENLDKLKELSQSEMRRVSP